MVLNKLIKRDTLARIMLFKSYLGGALATWDLAGGMVPLLEVRPGILLTAFNATSLVAYFVYKKYAIWKLGLKDPKKFEAYVKEKTALSERVMELTAELKQNNKTKVEIEIFYEVATKLESIAEIESHFKSSQKLAKEVLLEMELVRETTSGLRKRLLLRKLSKVRTAQQLSDLSQQIRPNLNSEPSSRYTGMGLSLRGNCLPLLKGLFAR